MSLDLEQVALPLQELAQQLKFREREAHQRLERALQAASTLDQEELAALKQKIEASRGKVRWPAAGLSDAICRSYPLPPCPTSFTVMAVDGSHIEIEHHRAIQCYLINLGQVCLDYGEQPRAILSSKAMLYWEGKDLVIEDPQGSSDEESVEGVLLNARRSVEECQLLAQMTEELAGKQPALALLDGSLILWGLGAQKEFLQQALLERGFIPALDRMRSVASRHGLALASYISSPRSTEVINALRVSLCQYEVPDCSQFCFTREATRECKAVAGISDQELFSQFLSPGDRSPLFLSSASIVRNCYREHHIAFFYLHVGEEIARVEVPAWVAEQPSLVDLVHAVSFDQCRRGLGYPVALSEAHQQAVVTAADRDNFWRLAERTLVKEGIERQDSAKRRSKVTRWL